MYQQSCAFVLVYTQKDTVHGFSLTQCHHLLAGCAYMSSLLHTHTLNLEEKETRHACASCAGLDCWQQLAPGSCGISLSTETRSSSPPSLESSVPLEQVIILSSLHY